MENTSNKSIFFLTLSFICVWLILDNTWGRKYLDRFLSYVFPFYKFEGNTSNNTTEKTGGTVENNTEGTTEDDENNTSESDKTVVQPKIGDSNGIIRAYRTRQALSSWLWEKIKEIF